MATLVSFTKVTVLTPLEGREDVETVPQIVVRILPELGTGLALNGGAKTEKARPVLEAMVDSVGSVLPEVASLSKLDPITRAALPGEVVPLKLVMQSSGFKHNVPTEAVYFDLTFTPAVDLEDLSLYGFTYSQDLPGVWLPSDLLTYV